MQNYPYTHIYSICVNVSWPRCASERKLQCWEGKCFSSQLLPLSLSVATGSIPGEHDWLITTLNICVCAWVCLCTVMHSCMYVCFLMHLQVLFLAHFTPDWLTAAVHLLMCKCVFVHMSALCHSVCVVPLTPHLLVSSQQAFHWAITQCATELPLNRSRTQG